MSRSASAVAVEAPAKTPSLVCVVCRNNPARLRSPLCARCAGWVQYHRRQTAFQFRRYQSSVGLATTRLRNYGEDFAGVKRGGKKGRQLSVVR